MIKPKIALIPSGYKSGKVYSILPNDGDGDFDFARSSKGTRIRKDGLIEEVDNNVARLDWSDGNCPSLLLEPQRTNYATNNTSMDTYNIVGGSNPSPTLTANYTTAPDGTLTATRLQTSVTGTDYSLIGFPTTSDDGSGGGYYTASVHVKSNTGSSQEIAFYGQSSSPNNRTITTEWTRIEFTGQRLGNTKYAYLGTVNATDDDIDISVWGAQIELVDSYPSSLIYTEASTVTRLKDECYGGGTADLFNDNEGVLFLNMKSFVNGGTNRFIQIHDGSYNNAITLYFTSTTNRIVARVWAGGSSVLTLNYTVDDVTQYHKYAFKYKSGDYQLWVDGTKVLTNSLTTTPTGLNQIGFLQGTAGNDFFGIVKDLRYFDNGLTDAELTELTT